MAYSDPVKAAAQEVYVLLLRDDQSSELCRDMTAHILRSVAAQIDDGRLVLAEPETLN